MKILITTDLYTTETNGVVTSVKNLREELQEKGHDVRILTLSGGFRSYKEDGVYYIRSVSLGAVYPNVRMPTSYRHRLIRELVDWRPDVIHSQCEFFTFQYAQRIARLTDAPLVHTYHTLYEQYVPYLIHNKRVGDRIVRVASRRRLKSVDRIIAPTRKVQSALVNYGVQNDISVVPSGISLEQHYQRLSGEERMERRRALGIRDDQVVLLNLGRLGTEKNLDELLELFAKALSRHSELVFLIVGDGPAREHLTALAGKLGISDRVIFTGMVPPLEVQNYYQMGDIFVSASTSETQGLTYIEAAANGLPQICRKDPCLQDVILQGENGYEYTNEQEFLWALDAVLADPVWRAKAGKRSEEIAASFDKNTFGESVETIYKSVL